MINVKGYCPMGCGETLFVAEGGYITCSYIHCPAPDKATDLLVSRDLSEAWGQLSHLMTLDRKKRRGTLEFQGTSRLMDGYQIKNELYIPKSEVDKLLMEAIK